MSPAEVVACARTWIGTPYQHQQRLKGVAVDCAGLIIGVARELGIVPQSFDVAGYARVPDGVSLQGYCDQFMTRTRAMQVGDVAVFHHPRSNGRTAAHMGIVAGYLHGGFSVIHAMGEGPQKVVEHRLDEATAGRIVAVYRMPGVE